jgi:type I restriction enzyme S subunit
MSEALEQLQKAEPRRFRPYPEYKDSGIEWLGKIPVHWEVERLKCLATLNDEALAESTDPDLEISYVDISSVDALKGITTTDVFTFEKAPTRARRIVRDGDVIISTVRTYLRAIASIENPEPNLIVSTGFAVIRSRELDSSFTSYALRAPYFVERVVANSVGVSYPAITASKLTCFPITYPSSDEQRTIAAFLDHETAKIDALVAKKERLIELLQEKRTALITRAVTKGLDPNAPVKDSGVEWLGEIPAHWEVVRVKSITAEHKQGFYTEQAYVDDGVKLVRITDIDDNADVSFVNMPFVDIPERTERQYCVSEGDFLFARSGTIGRFGVIRQPERAVFASYLIRFRFKEMNLEFLRYVFCSSYFRESLIASLHGGANQNIHAENIKERWLLVPSSAEQKSIAAFLDRETAKIDALVAKIRVAIERLKEYRTALISAAVTGKIDVREEAK